MRTGKDYLDAYQKFAKMNTHYDYEKFKSTFDIKEMEVLLDIVKNAEKFNSGKWGFLQANFGDNKRILYKMITSGHCPIDILERIANNTETVKNNITRSWDRPDFESDILTEIAKQNIPKSLFDKIYPYIDSQLLSMFDTQYYSNKDKVNKLDEQVIKNICLKVLETYEPPKGKKHSYISVNDIDHTTDCFQYLRDRTFMREISNKNIHENIRTALLNNKNLDPQNPYDAELMYEIYSGGCVIENIRNFTPQIKREISESLYEAYLTGFDETTGLIKEKNDHIYYNAKSVLTELASKGNLDEDFEYDLGLRLLDQKCRSTDQLVSAVFNNTKNVHLMERIKDIKSGDKVEAYTHNKNLPPFILEERSTELLTKMKKYIDKGQDRKIPDVWHEHLANYCTEIAFTPEQYSLLSVRAEKKLALNIVTSKTTPKDDLIAFANRYTDNAENWKSYLAGNILMGSKLNIFCRENDITEQVRDHLMKYCIELPSSTTVEDVTGKTYHNNLSYATQSINAVTDYCPKEQYEKVYNFFKEYIAKPDITPREKNLLEYTIAIMDRNIEKIKDTEKCKQETDITKWSDKYLREEIKRVREDFPWNEKSIDILVALDKNYDKILTLYDECDRREFFKEKEEMTEER